MPFREGPITYVDLRTASRIPPRLLTALRIPAKLLRADVHTGGLQWHVN